jgi:hypothetical protein
MLQYEEGSDECGAAVPLRREFSRYALKIAGVDEFVGIIGPFNVTHAI